MNIIKLVTNFNCKKEFFYEIEIIFMTAGKSNLLYNEYFFFLVIYRTL